MLSSSLKRSGRETRAKLIVVAARSHFENDAEIMRLEMLVEGFKTFLGGWGCSKKKMLIFLLHVYFWLGKFRGEVDNDDIKFETRQPQVPFQPSLK